MSPHQSRHRLHQRWVHLDLRVTSLLRPGRASCPEPAALAAFYANITGGEVTFSHEDEWATMCCEGARLEFMGASDYRAPRWPEDPARVHIDVFADPAGHPFCLSLIDEVG